MVQLHVVNGRFACDQRSISIEFKNGEKEKKKMKKKMKMKMKMKMKKKMKMNSNRYGCHAYQVSETFVFVRSQMKHVVKIA